VSLTSRLSDASSPVSAFFRQNFAFASRFASDQNRQIKSLHRLVCPTNGWDASLVGAAIDYRIRTFFGLEEDQERDLVGMLGMRRIADFTGLSGKGLGQYTEDLFSLRRVMARQKPGGELEGQYIRHCLLLAKSEIYVRAGRLVPEVLQFLYQLDRAGWNRSLLDGVASEATISDMRGLAHLFARKHWGLVETGNSARLNPSFGQYSEALGGADADLVLGDTLYDIKTTVRLISCKNLAQIMAYSFLDDEIARTGFYFSRFGALVSWDVGDLVKEASGGNLSLHTARDSFRKLVLSLPEESHTPYPGEKLP